MNPPDRVRLSEAATSKVRRRRLGSCPGETRWAQPKIVDRRRPTERVVKRRHAPAGGALCWRRHVPAALPPAVARGRQSLPEPCRGRKLCAAHRGSVSMRWRACAAAPAPTGNSRRGAVAGAVRVVDGVVVVLVPTHQEGGRPDCCRALLRPAVAPGVLPLSARCAPLAGSAFRLGTS